MLYISRRVGYDEFGVFDTDDNIESIISRTELVDAVSKLGVSIEGVHVYIPSLGIQAPKVSFVDPYQDERYITPIQVKTKLMKHVNVTLWGTRITAVTWRDDELISDVSIRLSDFGDVCESGLLLGNSTSFDAKVTLIVDDKVEVRENSFIWGRVDLPSVFIDVREMTNEIAVEEVYKSWLSRLGHASTHNRLSRIIDSAKRKIVMKARTGRC